MNLSQLAGKIDDYFFACEADAHVLAAMRMGTALVLLAYYSVQLRDIYNFSRTDGYFVTKDYQRLTGQFPQCSLFELFPNSRLLPLIVIIGFFVSGIASFLGFCTHFSLGLFLVFTVSIQSRTFVIMFSGADSIARTLLLCLALTESGNALSVDRLLFDMSDQPINGWTIRLLQVYLCFVYFWSAIHKLHCEYWISGQAASNALYSPIWSRRTVLEFAANQGLSRVSSHSVMFFEFFAPVLFFIDETRLPTMVFAMLMHAGIAVFLRIGSFGPIMMVALLSFYAIN